MDQRALRRATTVSLGLAALVLAGCAPAVSPSPTAHPMSPAASAPAQAPTAVPTEPAAEEPDSSTASESIRDALTSGDRAALAGWMADRVEVALAASEEGGSLTAAAAADWVLDRFPVPGTEWEFMIDSATIADYADGDYARWFPEGVLVGHTQEEYPQVIAITVSGERITQVLVAFDDVLRF